MARITRRDFVGLAGGALATPAALRQGAPTAVLSAADVVGRIQRTLGVPWKPDTLDTFKAGTPSAPVTGIVTTAMATMEVLGRAVEAGANFVITSEPTFYGRTDSPTPPAGRGGAPSGPAAAPAWVSPADPVFAAKNDFIRRHGLIVWRFSDHWPMRRPNPMAQGLADALGWPATWKPDAPAHVSIPAIRLDALASHVAGRLNARGGVRVIGRPQMDVRRVALLPGITPISAALDAVPHVDAIVAGEVREWETVEYVRDAVTAGGNKALILVGRVLSEGPGMHLCAQWLGKVVPELSTTWLATGDPYWRPL